MIGCFNLEHLSCSQDELIYKSQWSWFLQNLLNLVAILNLWIITVQSRNDPIVCPIVYIVKFKQIPQTQITIKLWYPSGYYIRIVMWTPLRNYANDLLSPFYIFIDFMNIGDLSDYNLSKFFFSCNL